MKHFNIKQLPLALLLAAGMIAASVPVLADEKEEAEMKMPIPATAAGIWQAIDMHVAEIRGGVAKGKLDDTHMHAYAVRDLVRALPTHSPGLSPDVLSKVKSQGKFVDTLAERLDKSGDANDKAGTETNLRSLEKVLTGLRALYPAMK